MSFLYGQFLGVSRNGEAVVFDTFDPVFADLEAAVLADRRTADMSRADLGDVVRSILGGILDPDSRGDPYVFSGVPGCPACGSTNLAEVSGTEELWPSEAGDAGHSGWDRLDSTAKTEKVRGALDELA